MQVPIGNRAPVTANIVPSRIGVHEGSTHHLNGTSGLLRKIARLLDDTLVSMEHRHENVAVLPRASGNSFASTRYWRLRSTGRTMQLLEDGRWQKYVEYYNLDDRYFIPKRTSCRILAETHSTTSSSP
jgi:hypothetical protein